jgi:hypothetical protein
MATKVKTKLKAKASPFKLKPVDSPAQDRAVSPERQRIIDPVRGDRVVTSYNPAMALEMCERIADGETLREVCKPGNGFVSYYTFRRWLLMQPELVQAYTEARTLSAIRFEEESIDMAREIRAEPGTAQRVRAYDITMNHMRWVAARRNPQLFSEKAAIKLTVPIQINTNLDLGGKLIDQTLHSGGESTYTLEATVHESIEAMDAKPLLEGGKPKKTSLTKLLKDKEEGK